MEKDSKSFINDNTSVHRSYDSQGKLKKKSLKDTNVKWLMLALSTTLSIGAYFCYDNPAPIETTLEEDFGISQFQFAFLYAAYSIPNTVTPLFGGVFLDKLGAKFGILTFCLIQLTGQGFFCCGGYIHSYKLMIFGRVIMGVGAENVFVANHFLLGKWFKGNTFNVALNIAMCVGVCFLALNGLILPLIYNPDSMDKLGNALLVGVGISFIATVSGLFAGLLQSKEQAMIGNDDDGLSDDEKFHFRDIRGLSYAFWLSIGGFIFIYSGMFPYFQVSSKIMQYVYKIDHITAGRLYAMPYYFLVVSAPFTGWYTVKHGNKLNIYLIGCLLQIFGHLLNMLIPECEEACYIGVLPVVIAGLSFAMVFPMAYGIIPFVSGEHAIGTGFGIAGASTNYADFFSPLIGSKIHDSTIDNKYGYYWQSFYWVCTSTIAFIFILLLWIENRKNYGNRMNQNQEEFELHEEAQEVIINEQMQQQFGYLTFENKQKEVEEQQ